MIFVSKWLNSFIKPIDEFLKVTPNPEQCGPGSNGNERGLFILQPLEQELQHQTQFSVIPKTLVGEALIFLQRCSQRILQPRLKELANCDNVLGGFFEQLQRHWKESLRIGDLIEWLRPSISQQSWDCLEYIEKSRRAVTWTSGMNFSSTSVKSRNNNNGNRNWVFSNSSTKQHHKD